MPMIACEHCDALNPSRATDCVECGRSLVAPAPPEPAAEAESGAAPAPPPLPAAGATPPELPPAGKRSARKKHVSRRNLDPEAVERSRQRQEFGRIKNIVFTVRSVYWAGLAFAVVQLLVYHLMIARVLAENELSGISLLIALLSWGQLGLMIAGGVLVLRAPFIWTLVGAIYWTLVTAQWLWVATRGDGILLEDGRVFAYLALMVFMVFAFWFAAAQARRVQALMAKNPDLQLQRKRLAPAERGSGAVAEEAEERRRLEWHGRNRSTLRLILMGVGLLAVLVGGVWVMTRPPSVRDAAERFAQIWASNSTDAIDKLFHDGRRVDSWQKGFRQRGWQSKRPDLGELQVEAFGDERASVRFACGDDELALTWQLAQPETWKITSFVLPELQVGDIDDGIAAFRSAWAATGTDALYDLFPSKNRERMVRGVGRSLKKRDWLEQRPALGDVDDGRTGASRRRVLFELGDDELAVTLEWWHPSWRVMSFRPPPQ